MAGIQGKERSTYVQKETMDGNERIVIDGEHFITPEQITEGVEEKVEKLKQNAYASISKIADFLYSLDYESTDYDFAREYFEGKAPIVPAACSAIRKGDFVGRNFDWLNNYEAAFMVRTPSAQGHYGVIGVAGGHPEMTIQEVDSREYSDLYKVLPFYLQDGVNEHGLFAEINVAPALGNTQTVPTEEKTDRICSLMLVRYILDKYQSVDEAVDDLTKHVEIFIPQGLIDMGYEPHFLIADQNKTVVLEIVNNGIAVLNEEKLTNFHLYGVRFRQDGSVFTNADAEVGNFPTSYGIEEHGSGLERWNILNAYDGTTAEEMRELMNSVYFTKAYTLTSGDWYSEFVGGDITVDTKPSNPNFIARINEYRRKYSERSKDTAETWLTVHSCVYDLAHNSISITAQEKEGEHFVSLVNRYVSTVNGIAPDEHGNVEVDTSVNYEELPDKPQINDVELSGNKTAAQLGLQPHDVFARMTNPYKTTFTEVQAAFNAGKQVYIEYTPPRSHPGTYVRMKLASEYGSAAFYFVAIEGNKKYTTTLYNNDTWDPVTVVTLATSTDLEDKQDVINLDNKLSYSFLSDTPAIPTTLAGLSDDSTHRVVTDTEKSTWNNKATTTDVVTQSASVAIKPNKITHLGTITGSVNITLEAGETSKAAIYDFIFTTDANISSITWATGITWEKKETPVIKANTTYEVCISENLAVITEF